MNSKKNFNLGGSLLRRIKNELIWNLGGCLLCWIKNELIWNLGGGLCWIKIELIWNLGGGFMLDQKLNSFGIWGGGSFTLDQN